MSILACDALLKLTNLETSPSEGDGGLRGASLIVRRGETVAISGLNGDGKDALCRCLAGELAATAGAIIFDGKALENRRHIAARTGLIAALANNRVFDEMSVEDNLKCSFAWQTSPMRHERMASVLATFPALRARLAQRADTLSGGEQQMLTLARALLSGPKLIVLEEPWLGLAPSLIDFFIQRISEISHKEHVSVLWTEESRERAIQRSDSAYDMVGGRLVPLGY